LQWGPLTLRHRVGDGTDGNAPTALNATCCAQRATPCGLLFAEATLR
jgi:hypothetical protein